MILCNISFVKRKILGNCVSILLMVFLCYFSLTKDESKRPKYKELLVSMRLWEFYFLLFYILFFFFFTFGKLRYFLTASSLSMPVH